MSARLIMKLRVAERSEAGDGVITLSLIHTIRPELPSWRAGAHVDVHLPDGRIRQYSLCGDPADRLVYRIAVRRETDGRGGSDWLHENIEQNSMLHVSAPRTHFSLTPTAGRHVFVAGGIGITPFLAMGREASARGEAHMLHYCAHDADAAPLLAEAKAVFGANLGLHFSGSNRLDVPALVSSLTDEPQTHLYVCGPPRLVDAVRGAASAADWPLARLHFESFKPAFDENYVPGAFTIEIASTGRVLDVPANRSALDVLLEAGFMIPYSCQLGVCGACQCRYLSGTVEHRDQVLNEDEGTQSLMLCVSRSRSGLVLDL